MRERAGERDTDLDVERGIEEEEEVAHGQPPAGHPDLISHNVSIN